MPNYQASSWTIEELFRSLYKIPVYQRPYSWGSDQVHTLLIDMYNSYLTNPQEQYYSGNIVLRHAGTHAGNIVIYDVIDGQQRTTTFSLILLCGYCMCKEAAVNIADTRFSAIIRALWTPARGGGYDQNPKAIVLGRLENDFFKRLYDVCYSELSTVNTPDINAISRLACNPFERRVLDNYGIIKKFFETRFANDIDEILNFYDYILRYVTVVAIYSSDSLYNTFPVFESINAKGLQLDSLDKIKSYLFSKINEVDFDSYLRRWGELIVSTNDNLFKYIEIYIRAKCRYYKNSLTVENFQKICENKFDNVFEVATIEEGVKKFIDDLHTCFPFFSALFSFDEARTYLSNNNKMKYYYNLLLSMSSFVVHQPLFFRLFEEKNNGIISENDANEIVIETIRFLIKTIKICGFSGKTAVDLMSDIMGDVITRGNISLTSFRTFINDAYRKLGITNNEVTRKLMVMDCYSNEGKKLGISLLALYEQAISRGGTISWSATLTAQSSAFSNTSQVHHLLVQTPDHNDVNFMYYENDGLLALKPGHDFPGTLVNDGMPYDDFKKVVLNRIGNLSLLDQYDNAHRGNNASNVNGAIFANFSDITNRTAAVADFIVNNF